MSKTVNYVAGLASEMIRNDNKRDALFDKIDRMVELDWDLPEEMDELKWMRKIVSTDPLSAITVGRRTLATVRPKAFIQPLNDNIVTKKMANWNEQNLLAQIKQANKRSEYDIVGDICESALRYGMVAVMTVPVKWQLKGTNNKRWIQNPGGFMVMVEKPRYVYPRFSPLGLESVLHVKLMRGRDAVSFYGDKARKIRNDLDGMGATEPNIVIYDYWDGDRRVTFAGALTEDTNITEDVNANYILCDEEMELPFLPWTVVKSGTSLSAAEDHKLRPTFASIAHSDDWELQNIAKTLAFSEAMGYAAAPRYKVTTISEDGGMNVEYGDINKPYVKKPHEDIEPLQPPKIDENLLHILDRTTAEIDRITGIKHLQSLDPPSGTAFATVNELIKAATSALDPAKMLAERAIGGVFEDMLKWCAHTREDMTALGDGTKDDLGKQYRLKWEHIQPDAIDVEVKLTAHVPTDRLQKINAATLLVKELDFPKAKAYKELDEENPEELRKEREQEIMNETMFTAELKKIQAQTDLQIQAVQMQMQAQMQQMQQARQMQMQAQMQQAQQMQPRQGGGPNEESMSQQRMANGGMSSTRTGAPRREAQSMAAKGGGFNPARGGISPNQMNPRGFTKEGATGLDRRGNAI